jgi:hypothetical protein
VIYQVACINQHPLRSFTEQNLCRIQRSNIVPAQAPHVLEEAAQITMFDSA